MICAPHGRLRPSELLGRLCEVHERLRPHRFEYALLSTAGPVHQPMQTLPQIIFHTKAVWFAVADLETGRQA